METSELLSNCIPYIKASINRGIPDISDEKLLFHKRVFDSINKNKEKTEAF